MVVDCFAVLDRYPGDNLSQRKSRRGRPPNHKVDTPHFRAKRGRPKATSSYDDDDDKFM